MYRKLLSAVVAFVFTVSFAAAEEIKGVVKGTNTQSNTLTLTVDGRSVSYPVGKDASFVSVNTVPGKKPGQTMEKVETLEGGIASLKSGSNVTVLTSKVDDKEVVTSVKVTGGIKANAEVKKKKKKKAAENPANKKKKKKKAK